MVYWWCAGLIYDHQHMCILTVLEVSGKTHLSSTLRYTHTHTHTHIHTHPHTHTQTPTPHPHTHTHTTTPTDTHPHDFLVRLVYYQSAGSPARWKQHVNQTTLRNRGIFFIFQHLKNTLF